MTERVISDDQTTQARIVIVDDHDLARAGLQSMVETEPSFEVVGQAKNGEEAVTLCRRVRPDLVLMDVRMPVLDGLAAIPRIRAVSPRTKVIIVTMHDTPDYLLEALKSGASGFLLKDASLREIITTVRQALAGETQLTPELATQLLLRLTGRVDATIEPLTPREREVLQLMVQGKTNRMIASALSISVGTAKIHVEHILGKLGATDRTQAAVRAIELGLLNHGRRD